MRTFSINHYLGTFGGNFRPSAVAHTAAVKAIAWWQSALFVPALLICAASVTQPGWIPQTDFAAFYQTALAQRLHVPAAALVARQPSLSPPTLSVLLWPLTFLPLGLAFWAWLGVNVLLVADTLRLWHQRVTFTPRLWMGLLLGSIGTVPLFLVWSHGQLGWIVGWCLTRAWLTSRGWLWLSLAIAIKPPVAFMVLALPVAICARIGASALGMSLLSIAVTGVAPWRVWLGVTGGVTWLDSPYNLSLWSVPARLLGGHPTLALLPTWPVVSVLVAIAALYWRAFREHGDRRWAIAGLVGIAASPIGWVHYLPSVLGPVLATWPRGSWMRAGITVLCVPGALMIALVPHGGAWLYPFGFASVLTAYITGASRE